MVESNITRRRVLQGAGAIGVASLGSTVIAAQEGGGQDGQSAAVRVAHASPDAPNVQVNLSQAGGGGTATDGNATAGGNDTGNETATGNETGGQDGGDNPQIGGVGFGEVSSYQEVSPGTYQVRAVPAQGPIEGFIQDLFGGGDDEQTVLFEDQIEVEQGTTYTLVAFGEVARGPIPAQAEMAGNETGATGQNETDGFETDENATDGMGENETDVGMGENETNATGGGGATGGEQLVSELAFGEHQTVDLSAGDYTLAFERADAAGMTGDTGGGLDENETDGMGGNETNDTVGMGDNETDDTVGTNDTSGGTSAQAGGSDRGFQVKVLEDDLSAPGDDSVQLRVFHAVPDVNTMSVSRTSNQGGAGANETGGGAGANETGGVGQNDTGIGGDAGQNETGGGAGGGGQNDTGIGGEGGQQQDGNVRQAQFSPDGNASYSGFAMGYFDPQAAASAGDQGGNETGVGNETGNATGAGNATGNQTGDGESGQEVAEDAQGAEFQFVTVQDAQGGERSDGGTGGLLDLAPPADD